MDRCVCAERVACPRKRVPVTRATQPLTMHHGANLILRIVCTTPSPHPRPHTLQLRCASVEMRVRKNEQYSTGLVLYLVADCVHYVRASLCMY